MQLLLVQRLQERLGGKRFGVLLLSVLGLSPQIQEQILAGDLGLSERQVRGVLREVRWEGQGGLLTAGNSTG